MAKNKESKKPKNPKGKNIENNDKRSSNIMRDAGVVVNGKESGIPG